MMIDDDLHYDILQVIRLLVPCLDDKKRLVRREAALARQKWIMLGQAGCD